MAMNGNELNQWDVMASEKSQKEVQYQARLPQLQLMLL